MSKKNKNLAFIILDDLYRYHKFSLLLIMLILATGMSVLLTTQQTRKMLFQKEQLTLQRDVLESEWRNLILEENVLVDPKRIEKKASAMGMKYVSPEDETVIVVKNPK